MSKISAHCNRSSAWQSHFRWASSHAPATNLKLCSDSQRLQELPSCLSLCCASTQPAKQETSLVNASQQRRWSLASFVGNVGLENVGSLRLRFALPANLPATGATESELLAIDSDCASWSSIGGCQTSHFRSVKQTETDQWQSSRQLRPSSHRPAHQWITNDWIRYKRADFVGLGGAEECKSCESALESKPRSASVTTESKLHQHLQQEKHVSRELANLGARSTALLTIGEPVGECAEAPAPSSTGFSILHRGSDETSLRAHQSTHGVSSLFLRSAALQSSGVRDLSPARAPKDRVHRWALASDDLPAIRTMTSLRASNHEVSHKAWSRFFSCAHFRNSAVGWGSFRPASWQNLPKPKSSKPWMVRFRLFCSKSSSEQRVRKHAWKRFHGPCYTCKSGQGDATRPARCLRFGSPS